MADNSERVIYILLTDYIEFSLKLNSELWFFYLRGFFVYKQLYFRELTKMVIIDFVIAILSTICLWSNGRWKKRGEAGSSFKANDWWLYIIYTSPAIQVELPLRIGKTKRLFYYSSYYVGMTLLRRIELQFIGRRDVLFTNVSSCLVHMVQRHWISYNVNVHQ